MLHKVAIVALAALLWLGFGSNEARSQGGRRDACVRDISRSVFESIPANDVAQQSRIADGCLQASLTARGIEAARARFYSGRAYRYAGNLDEAVRQLTLAVNLGSDFGGAFARELRLARLNLIDAHQAQGRIDLARATLDHPSLRPGDPAVAYKRALLNLAELGEAGEASAFDALRSVFTQSDSQLAGTPDNPGLSSEDIRDARSWLYRLSVSLGVRTLRLQAQAPDLRRADARRAIDVLRPAVDAINAACPEPGPIDCANGIAGTPRLGVLPAAARPTRDQLLNVYFQVGVAYLKAAGLQDSAASAALGAAGGIGGLGALDCFESALAPDADQNFRDARFAFESFIRRSAASGAPAADARWGLACTVLADLRRVNDESQRQRLLAQAIEQLNGAPQLPITFITLARAQALQGQWDSARIAYQRALETAGQTARCPAGRFELASTMQADLPSRIYLEMARTRYATLEAFSSTARSGAPADLYGRTVTQIIQARPGSLRDAEPELRCAVHLNPANAEARLALGHLYLRLGSEAGAGALDAPPFPRALEALGYFERPTNDNPEGRAEGLFLLSKRLTATQQAAIDRGRSRSSNDRGFRQDGDRAVDMATQAYNLAQRPDFRRQACLAQILFGEIDDQNYCVASGASDERAEGLLYEGLYWLRRGQRERPPERLRSWSRSIQAFNRGVAAAAPGQTAELGPFLPRAVDLRALLNYGQRYVLQCTGLNDGDTSAASDDVKAFFWLTGIPRQCGGPPS